MREPRPDRMKPPDSQNAMAMSHGISLENALNAWGNVSVLVSIDTPRPSMATCKQHTWLRLRHSDVDGSRGAVSEEHWLFMKHAGLALATCRKCLVMCAKIDQA